MVKSKVNNLQDLLKKTFSQHVEVIDQKTTLLTAPGEHYGSIMLALDVTLNTNNEKGKHLHLVAKLIPANEMLRLAFDIPVTFKKEVIAYTITIPTLVKLQQEHNVPADQLIDKLFPKCYGARISLDTEKDTVDEDGVILFENLKVQGYRTEDRLIGFDLDATRIIIQDLAKFHAVPIALKLLKPEEFKTKVMPSLVKNKGLEQLPAEVGKSFHGSIMNGAKQVPELAPYLERVQKVVDFAAENPYVNRPPPNELFATMVHSDYWTSNTMLLRDENGRALKNKMVDLQLMTYSSAVRDLIFFLFTSVINDVLDEHIDEFIKLYHDSFVNVLNCFNLDTKPYNWDAFQQELEEVAPTEVYHVLVMLKPICTEPGKVQNSLEDFQDTDWSREDLLGPNHTRKMKRTILAFVKKNWI